MSAGRASLPSSKPVRITPGLHILSFYSSQRRTAQGALSSFQPSRTALKPFGSQKPDTASNVPDAKAISYKTVIRSHDRVVSQFVRKCRLAEKSAELLRKGCKAVLKRIPGEKAKLWRVPELGNLELLRARFRKQRFGRHYHDGYAIGVIEGGALGFEYLGEHLVALPGNVNLAVPGEPHNGFAAEDQGWRYRMFYLPAQLLERAASEVADKPVRPPFFRQGVIEDPHLAGQIRSLHMALESPGISILEAETRLLDTLAHMVLRHAEDKLGLGFKPTSHSAVEKAVEYLEAHYQVNPSLESLSRVAGLSRFHFLRVFHKQMGLPPHTYLTQVRIRRAKELLYQGLTIADVALDTGFTDQSHLNRHFKRLVGVTPGAYSNSIQD